MSIYHKIQTIFKRDPSNKKKLLLWQWTLPEFEYLKDNKWELSEKIDGMNIRIDYSGQVNQVQIAGRSDNAQIPTQLEAKLRELFPLAKLQQYFGGGTVTLYGEGYGAGIQGGGGYSATQEFILFDVKIDGWWLRRQDVADIAQRLEIEKVPVINSSASLIEAIALVKEGFPSQIGNRNRTAEGVVARPLVELQSRSGDRIIAKLKHHDFFMLK